MNLTTEQKDKVRAAFVAFLEWADEHTLKCDAVEHTVTDNEKSAGTLDFVGDIDGEHTVIDFKSSKAIYIEYRYQIAAYKWMYNLDNSPEAVRCGILRLDKETGYPDYKDTTKSYESDLNVYHKMVDLFYARHPRLKKAAKII